jgi:hypothetical protein
MVEPNTFDIYLCDNCDAELYSEEAYKEHENSCFIEIHDSDDEMEDPLEEAIVGEQTAEVCDQSDFMAGFGLISVNNQRVLKGGSRANAQFDISSPEKLKRLPRRSRNTITLAKCHGIPISSPCGQLLMENVKAIVSEAYQLERVDRNERHCPGPQVDRNNKPKYLKPSFVPTIVGTSTTVTRSGNSRSDFNSRDSIGESYLSYQVPLYIKSRSCYFRNYKFPRRQFKSRSRLENFSFINRPMFKTLKGCEIPMKRLTEDDIEELKKLTKQQYEAQRQAKKDRIKEMNVVEFIDLCSSDGEVEEEDPIATNRVAGLPSPPSRSVIGGSFLSITNPNSGVKRNILGDRINRMSALNGARTHSGSPDHQTVLRQSSFLFTNTRTDYGETAAVFQVQNISKTKRSQINSWLQSVEVNSRALVKLT